MTLFSKIIQRAESQICFSNIGDLLYSDWLHKEAFPAAPGAQIITSPTDISPPLTKQIAPQI
jgi:hypothetical protein